MDTYEQRGHYMRKLAAFSILMLALAPLLRAAKPTQAVPPSAMIYGTFDTAGNAEIHESLWFRLASITFARNMTVPQDGAWLYGDAVSNRAYPNTICGKKWVGGITPEIAQYTPFFRLGTVPGDVCGPTGYCLACGVRFGGLYNSPRRIVVGSGSYEIVVVTENGGGQNDEVQFWLAQTNVADMTDLKIVEAKAEDDPTPAEDVDKNSRAYIAAANDAVPVTPTFLRGTREFGVAPGIAFNAVWDTGEASSCEIRPIGPQIGRSVVLVSVPKMKTGLHTFTITATTPSGKTWNAVLPDKVFVYNAALEAVINGGAPVTAGPVQFTRADNVLFRVQQQDLKGKAVTITRADWQYRNPATSVTIQSTDEPNFPSDSAEWGGVMHQGGLIIANLTLKTGKNLRQKSLSMFTQAVARTDPKWATPTRDLCENCWTDLGIKKGGHLPSALAFPSWQNVISGSQFPLNFGGGLALAMAGERKAYENGIVDDVGGVVLEAHRIPKPFPLYRPLNVHNDPADWANRVAVSQITTGPKRGYWYVTDHHYYTKWAYALNAYFNPASPEGASQTNYLTWVLTQAPGCTSNNANESCYTTVPVNCWSQKFGGQSYFSAASTAIDPSTGAPYPLQLLLTQVRTHEKLRHYDEALVTFVAQHKQQFDVGTIMEQVTSRDATEKSVLDAIDTFMVDLDFRYANDSAGGAYEVYNDPKAPFPLVEDRPVGSAPCTLYR